MILMSAVDSQPFPRGVLIGATSLLAFAIVVTAAGRYARLAAPAPMAAPTQPAADHAADLKFADQTNGGVMVTDAHSGAVVAVIQPNSGGFVRGVLRGLTRERKMNGIGAGPAFRLSQWADGHVQIEDLADGRTIDLDAFGPTNRQAFLELLPGARIA
jgi:putative photosynthetic complex assembly protein